MSVVVASPESNVGWASTFERARAHVAQALPDASISTRVVSPGQADLAVEEQLAGGDNVIVGTRRDFEAAMIRGAELHSEARFLLWSGRPHGPNLGGFAARMYQVTYLAGMVAGRQTRSGRLGVVSSLPRADRVRQINAFAQGARAVDPSIVVYVEWVGPWFDPVAERDATSRLIDDGAVDVVFGMTDSAAPLEASCRSVDGRCTRTTPRGDPVYAVGFHAPDACRFAPTRCLGSAYWNWGPLLASLLGDIQAGRWDAGRAVWSAVAVDPAQSAVHLSLAEGVGSSSMPDVVEATLRALAADEPAARMLPFAGEVRDADGQLRFTAEGPTDEDLQQMCWFVQGVAQLGRSAPSLAGCQGEP